MAEPLTVRTARGHIDTWDGVTLGWLIVDTDGAAAASPSMQFVSDVEADEIVAGGYSRGDMDVVYEQDGEYQYLKRDPLFSVPTTDTTGSTPGGVWFFDQGDNALISFLPVAEGAGFADWDVDPANGIAVVKPGESGVPAGGTTGQVLAKASSADGDTEWVDQTGGGDPLYVSATDPGDPDGDAAAWLRTPGDLRAFADFRLMADGPLPAESNGSNPEDPAALVSFDTVGAPFQPCMIIDGAVQSDMVTQVDPPSDTSTRTGFAVGVTPGAAGRVEWGHGGYVNPTDGDLVSNITSNIAVGDALGNAYLFDVVVGRVNTTTGAIDLGEDVSAGLRLVRDDLSAPTNLAWYALPSIPVEGERFGFTWDADGTLTGYHNGTAVITATDTTYDISTFVSVGMPLHQDTETAYFARVAWIGISEGDEINPDDLGPHYWTGTEWRLPVATEADPAVVTGGTVDVVSNVATSTLLGRTTAGTGDSEELSPSAARVLLDVYDSGTVDTAVAAKIAKSLVTTKGDLIGATGSGAPVRIGVGADGTTPHADSNSSAGILWARAARTHMFGSGSYTALAVNSATVTPTASRLYYLPFQVPKRTAFDRIAINHTSVTSTTGGYRLGIYASATGGVPGALVGDYGLADTTTAAAAKEVTISVTLDPGIYWAAVVMQVTGSSPVATAAGTCPILVPLSSVVAAAANNYLFEGSVTGALPSTASPSGNTTQPPLVWLRMA